MNQSTSGDSNVKDHLVKIKDIEQKTSLDFLWELSDGEESSLEAGTGEAWVNTWVD